jgi:DNA repair photolyase
MTGEDYIKGRGSQLKTPNRFLKSSYVTTHIEGLDEPLLTQPSTQVFLEQARSLVNPVTSPDLPLAYSINPYQGCEHGCVYCYARNTHEYYGFSAGLDFESKIMVKKNAPQLLEKFLRKPGWKASPLSLSGNTDCYQPLEREHKITRSLLGIVARFRNPVGIITKNSLVLRDLDILKELALQNLVHVYISITTLNEDLRSLMEPRTAAASKRLRIIETLAAHGIPVGVMNAPVIPGLNHHEIPTILKAAAEHGACSAGMTVVRLNGAIGRIFEDWLRKNFPDRFDKVWNQICSLHGGSVNDSHFGRRMTGEGNLAEVIRQLFQVAHRKYFAKRGMPAFNLQLFRPTGEAELF